MTCFIWLLVNIAVNLMQKMEYYFFILGAFYATAWIRLVLSCHYMILNDCTSQKEQEKMHIVKITARYQPFTSNNDLEV